MQLDSLKVEAFAVLAQYLNFSRAAAALNITQPALSKKISRLEDEMGVTLFVRSKRLVELTPAGHELVGYWKSKLEIDREFFSRIGGTKDISGTLKIASFSSITSYCVLPALSHFFQRNRELNLELFTRETIELPKMLLGGNVDLILHDELINRENVTSELISQEHLIHVTPKKGGRDLPFLDNDINDRITFTYLRSQGMKSDIRRLFVDDIHAILAGVKSGLGQAVISQHLFDPRNMKLISARKKVESPIYLCYLKRAYMPQLISQAVNELKSNLDKYVRASHV